MCVIIVKRAGQPLPDINTLRLCMRRNPDGFGFATKDSCYHTLNDEAFINKLYSSVDILDPCIIHCRIATHGSIKKSNCHPFYDSNTGIYFAHNGMLAIKAHKDKTDSETAFRDLFVPVIKMYGMTSREMNAAIRGIIGGSKFAFLDKNGQIYTFGHFFEIDGLEYSNLYHYSVIDERNIKQKMYERLFSYSTSF